MDFQTDVIEASHKQPILVDFWAPWCGPCQYLGPTLEALDAEQPEWKLVKVNVDENQGISQKYGIRGIPDVRLFVSGEEVDRFTGALPKSQIEKWLTKNIPNVRDEQIQQIINAKVKQSSRIESLKQFVHQNPDYLKGKIILAKNIVWHEPNKGHDLVSEIKITDDGYAEANAIKEVAEFLEMRLSASLPIDETLIKAQDSLRLENLDVALDHLVSAVLINKNYLDELPRKVTVALFTLLGPAHEFTKKYRKRFDMALY